MSQAYLALAHPELGWVDPTWRGRVPVLLSFGLWQWITLVWALAVLVLLVALAIDDDRNDASRAGSP